jgi:hypothetical protein
MTKNMRRYCSAFTILCVISVSTAQAATVTRETRFGAFTLTEEVRTRDPGEPLIMHMATEWTKLRLIWRSTDQAVTTEIVDDGAFLDSESRVELLEKSCSSSGGYFQYAPSDDQSGLWRSMRQSMSQLLKNCAAIPPSAKQSYPASLTSASDDFLPAIAAFKKRAAILFPRPGFVRCSAPTRSKNIIITNPNAGRPCRMKR